MVQDLLDHRPLEVPWSLANPSSGRSGRGLEQLCRYITPDDAGEVTGYEDVFTKSAMCRKHYAACGLGEAYVDTFVR